MFAMGRLGAAANVGKPGKSFKRNIVYESSHFEEA